MHNFSEYKELYHYDNKRSLVRNEMTGDVRMMKILPHYDEDVSPSLMVNSNNIEVFRIIDLYSRICTINTSLTTTFSTDSTSLCNLRENMALTSFNSFTGSKIINLIFHKICIVSYLKYE